MEALFCCRSCRHMTTHVTPHGKIMEIVLLFSVNLIRWWEKWRVFYWYWRYRYEMARHPLLDARTKCRNRENCCCSWIALTLRSGKLFSFYFIFFRFSIIFDAMSGRVSQSSWKFFDKTVKKFCTKECMRIISIVSSFSIRFSYHATHSNRRKACECRRVTISMLKFPNRSTLSDWYMNGAYKNNNNLPRRRDEAICRQMNRETLSFRRCVRVIKIDLFVSQGMLCYF